LPCLYWRNNQVTYGLFVADLSRELQQEPGLKNKTYLNITVIFTEFELLFH